MTFKNGTSSISMGHGFHSYVAMLNNQRVTQTPSFRMVQDLYEKTHHQPSPQFSSWLARSQSKKLVTHVLHVVQRRCKKQIG